MKAKTRVKVKQKIQVYKGRLRKFGILPKGAKGTVERLQQPDVLIVKFDRRPYELIGVSADEVEEISQP